MLHRVVDDQLRPYKRTQNESPKFLKPRMVLASTIGDDSCSTTSAGPAESREMSDTDRETSTAACIDQPTDISKETEEREVEDPKSDEEPAVEHSPAAHNQHPAETRSPILGEAGHTEAPSVSHVQALKSPRRISVPASNQDKQPLEEGSETANGLVIHEVPSIQKPEVLLSPPPELGK